MFFSTIASALKGGLPANHVERAQRLASRRAEITQSADSDRKRHLAKARECTERSERELADLEALAEKERDALDAKLATSYVAALDKAIKDWQSEPARSKLGAVAKLVTETSAQLRDQLGEPELPSIFIAFAMGRAIVGNGAADDDANAPHLDGTLTQEGIYIESQPVLNAARQAQLACLDKNLPRLSTSLETLEGALLDVARTSPPPSEYHRARFAALRSRLTRSREQAHAVDAEEAARSLAERVEHERLHPHRSFTRGELNEALAAGYNPERIQEFLAQNDGNVSEGVESVTAP